MQADYSSVLYMVLLIATGFALVKTRLLRGDHIGALPALLLGVAYPALIINAVTSVDVRSLAAQSVWVVGVTIAVTLALFFAGRLVLRRYNTVCRDSEIAGGAWRKGDVAQPDGR